MSNPVAGWYPDPAGGGGYRFWDGATWTSQTSANASSIPPESAPTGGVPDPSSGWGTQDAYGQQSGYQYPTDPEYSYGAAGQPPPPVGYRAPEAALPVNAKTGPSGQILSGWWRRAGGYVLDGLIVGIPTAIVAMIVLQTSGGAIIDDEAAQSLEDKVNAGSTDITFTELTAILGPGFATFITVTMIVSLSLSFINGVVLVARSGQTIGDRVVKVRKVMGDRRVPSLGIAFLRWIIPPVAGIVLTIVPFGIFMYYLNFIWAAWDPRAQTVNDKIVRTYVERSDLNGPPL